MNKKALVLNSNWVPISVVTTERTMVLVFRKSAKIICPESYEIFDIGQWIDRSIENPDHHNVIITPSMKLHRPEILLLSEYGGVPHREVSFTRRNLYRRDNFTCQYCGRRKPHSQLSMDHVIPRSKGGPSSWENCVLACLGCNSAKADKLLKDCSLNLIRKPSRPTWRPFFDLPPEKMPDAWKNFIKK